MKLTVKKIKVFCLVFFIGFGVVFFAINKRFAHSVGAFSTGPPAGVTGAPGEATCTTCHTANPTTGQFTIIAPQTYVPGQTYQITVRHVNSNTSRRRWGFELTALAGNNAAGGFANIGNTTQTLSENGRNYIEHTLLGSFPNQTGTAFWNFNWTAPATNVGAVTFYAAGNQANNDGTTDGDQIYTANVTVQPEAPPNMPRHVAADFDGDGKSDVSVFRPGDGGWYINRSTAGFFGALWGSSNDKPVPADYDGDEKTDLAVWRENGTSSAVFYIINSSNNTFRGLVFGQTGDVPAVGDYDGDGKADPAVYRSGASGGQSFFYYIGSTNNGFSAITWGIGGDLPVRGDFDGDKKSDAAVFRPTDSSWYIRRSSDGSLFAVQWGFATDKRAAADYDGDGKTDVAIFRDGNWYILQSSTGSLQSFSWGLANDVPVPGDYDGDNKADVAVYRNGNWYIRMSGNGSLSAQNFGLSSDIPVPFLYTQ